MVVWDCKTRRLLYSLPEQESITSVIKKPMAKLIFTDENYAGRVYNFVLEKTTVGRGDQNTLVIHDSSLSSNHCEILVNGPEVIVRDLGSRNGTFVNGARLTKQQAQLKSGQTVRFGSVEARLELDSPFEDTATDGTAIHTMSRIMRDQRRALKNPKPVDVSMTLESSDLSANEGHTVITSRTPPPGEDPIIAAPQIAEGLPGKTSKRAVILIAVVLVLSLIVLLWMWRVSR